MAQEQEDHQHHQRDGADQRQRDIVQRLAHRDRAVVDLGQLDRVGQLLAQLGQRGLDRVDHAHRVGAWLALDRERDRGLAVEVAVGLQGLDAVLDRGDIAQPHRAGRAVQHDQVGEFGCVAELPVGLQRQGLARPLERADRGVDVGGAQRRRHLVDADVARGQRFRAHAHAHRVALGAVDVDLGHAGQGR